MIYFGVLSCKIGIAIIHLFMLFYQALLKSTRLGISPVVPVFDRCMENGCLLKRRPAEAEAKTTKRRFYGSSGNERAA